MKEIWIEYAKNWDKCQLHIKRKKWVKVFKFIRTNEPFDKYVAETVELDQRLTMDDKLNIWYLGRSF